MSPRKVNISLFVGLGLRKYLTAITYSNVTYLPSLIQRILIASSTFVVIWVGCRWLILVNLDLENNLDFLF